MYVILKSHLNLYIIYFFNNCFTYLYDYITQTNIFRMLLILFVNKKLLLDMLENYL